MKIEPLYPASFRSHVPRSIPGRSRYSPLIKLARISSTQGKPVPATATEQHGSSHLQPSRSPLAVLPLSNVCRSYLMMSMSSSPLLLATSTRMMQKMLQARSVVFDVDRNPMIKWILKQTFYAQFCAGENKAEVEQSVKNLLKIGYHGVILEYAREVLDDGKAGAEVSAEAVQKDIDKWRTGLLETVRMVNNGDFVGLKWSGMGSEALRLLKANKPPSEPMMKAMTDLCDAAAAKGALLLPAAEPQNAQAAVDAWTLEMAQKYNTGQAVLYNTYQCYLKSTPATLSRHLAFAAQKGFTLGIKLVRGAYLGTEQRQFIRDTKEDTDRAYDTVTADLLQQRWGAILKPPKDAPDTFPSINVMLATHNLASVQHARRLRNEQKASGQQLVKLAYGSLQGMADDVSAAMIETKEERELEGRDFKDVPKVFKCTTWGDTSDCLHYLLRRAAENKDAMSRTHMTRDAMGRELWRRWKGSFGLAR